MITVMVGREYLFFDLHATLYAKVRISKRELYSCTGSLRPQGVAWALVRERHVDRPKYKILNGAGCPKYRGVKLSQAEFVKFVHDLDEELQRLTSVPR